MGNWKDVDDSNAVLGSYSTTAMEGFFAWAVRVMICRALAQHPENASDLC